MKCTKGHGLNREDAEGADSMTMTWTVRVLEGLRGLRLSTIQYEVEICTAIAAALERRGIPFEREVSLGDRRRIDFLCAGGVGIEVKMGSPNRAALVAQARRYCSSERVLALVLVVERSVVCLPETIEGTPVYYVGLNSNWGVAV